MLKAFLDRILEIQKPTLHEVDGNTFSTERLTLVEEPLYYPESISCSTLYGIIDYLNIIKKNEEETLNDLMIHIGGPQSVSLVSNLDERMKRSTMIVSTPVVTKFPFDREFTVEEFLVTFLSCFEQDEVAQKLRSYVSNIVMSTEIKVDDDGVTQVVETRDGLNSSAGTPVPTNIKLKPYWTFPEIDFPEVTVFTRLKKSKHEGLTIKLISSDNPFWRNECVDKIYHYLADALNEQEIYIPIVR